MRARDRLDDVEADPGAADPVMARVALEAVEERHQFGAGKLVAFVFDLDAERGATERCFRGRNGDGTEKDRRLPLAVLDGVVEEVRGRAVDEGLVDFGERRSLRNFGLDPALDALGLGADRLDHVIDEARDIDAGADDAQRAGVDLATGKVVLDEHEDLVAVGTDRLGELGGAGMEAAAVGIPEHRGKTDDRRERDLDVVGDHRRHVLAELVGLDLLERLLDRHAEEFELERLAEVIEDVVVKRLDRRFGAGVAGDDNDQGAGVMLVDVADEGEAVDVVHAQVGDDDRGGVVLEPGDGVAAAIGGGGPVTGTVEQAAQRIGHAALVIDDEDAFLPHGAGKNPFDRSEVPFTRVWIGRGRLSTAKDHAASVVGGKVARGSLGLGAKAAGREVEV